jgi:hypothetical protein
MADKIEVQNVGQPSKTYRVDVAKYTEMRERMLAVLPAMPPGMKVADLIDALRPTLSDALFPQGETCGWWVKCVQLDLEAKGIIARTPAPVRLWRVQ